MTPVPAPAYRGRFAPSPTGPLHLGSLVAAMASYLEARTRQGEWLVRIEDVDESRTRPGAADLILRTLERLGLRWDGAVWYQTRRKQEYDAALEDLLQRGIAYRCACTRAEIARSGRAGVEGPVYPGTCRAGIAPGRRARTVRVHIEPGTTTFDDRIAGRQRQDVAAAVGDFVIRRADGFTAYQLAVVLDDRAQGITDVVRGADLLLSTPRQIRLQRLLGFPTPGYAHVPLVRDHAGRKLSKSEGDAAVNADAPLASLLAAWRLLGQTGPRPAPATPAEFWDFALGAWRIADTGKAHVNADTL